MVISFPRSSDKATKSSDDIPPYESLISAVNVPKHLLHLCCDADFSVVSNRHYCLSFYCLRTASSYCKRGQLIIVLILSVCIKGFYFVSVDGVKLNHKECIENERASFFEYVLHSNCGAYQE